MMDVTATCAAQTVRSAARRLTRRYEEALRPTGLTASQYTVLAALLASGGLGQGTIANVLSFEQTTVTRLLAAMARRGWVRFQRDPTDARRKIVQATPEGGALYQQAEPLWRQVQHRTLAGLDEEEWAQLRRLLGRLTE